MARPSTLVLRRLGRLKRVELRGTIYYVEPTALGNVLHSSARDGHYPRYSLERYVLPERTLAAELGDQVWEILDTSGTIDRLLKRARDESRWCETSIRVRDRWTNNVLIGDIL